jgi:Zn-dependent peptidase ImmA (M78 family)
MTPEQILRVIEEKRELHPELARPLGWNGFRRILVREDISLVVTEMARRDAQLLSFDGRWAILLNSNSGPRRHLYHGVHELAHLWCHHDRTCARWERIYNMQDEEGDDPRESDAELFCVYVLGGNRFRRTF